MLGGRASESIPVQKWNSPQVGQVHYRPIDADAGTSNDHWQSLAICFLIIIQNSNDMLLNIMSLFSAGPEE